ncbi:hypothetical protein G9A89_009506 [Geosiphon pyriformis]|nr:hypothetical protein G9A89_009506 [Geosiphon pyriformis]
MQATDKLVEYLWGCEIVGVNCLNLVQVSMEVSQILKSGEDDGDRSPDEVDNHELNPSKYSPYGSNNSNRLNADVAIDENASVDNMLMALPGV